MRKNKLLAVSAAAMIVLCSGCSYKEVDEQLQNKIQQATNSSVDGYTSDGEMYVEVPPQPEDQIEYRGIDEVFSAYKKYTVNMDETSFDIEKGNEGLTYTLKGVTIYPSIDDAEVDMYNCLTDGTEFITSNSFILIDVHASYTAPSEGKEEIIASATELSGICLESKRTQQAAGELYPVLGYFSLRPKEDDPRLDAQHQSCSYIIRDGESIDFQIGLFCAQECIDDKNVFLEVNEVPWIDGEVTGDTTRKLFVLFSEGGE